MVQVFMYFILVISEIVSVKAKTSKGVWTNHFAFLDAGRLANGLYF